MRSVQPRIRLTRSFDERSHSYLGYSLTVDGTCDEDSGVFIVGIGKAAQAKHGFHAGMSVSLQAAPVPDARTETSDFYKASRFRVLSSPEEKPGVGPPFLGIPQALEVYRARGHRRLASRTFDTKCASCIWGCRMPVELIPDHWKPHIKRYRSETFCYGPKSCELYRAGPNRKVPGRHGTSYTEEDWIDEEATSHRGDDE